MKESGLSKDEGSVAHNTTGPVGLFTGLVVFVLHMTPR